MPSKRSSFYKSRRYILQNFSLTLDKDRQGESDIFVDPVTMTVLTHPVLSHFAVRESQCNVLKGHKRKSYCNTV